MAIFIIHQNHYYETRLRIMPENIKAYPRGRI